MSLPELDKIDFKDISIAKPKPRPQFTVLYGSGKTGKTSAAIYSEEPVILPVGNESGQEIMIKYGVPCFEGTDSINGLKMVFGGIAKLLRTDHTRKTLIIDNLSRFRELVDDDILIDHKGEDLTAYGKAQALAFPYYKRLVAGIKLLMAKKQMNVVLIAHDVSYNVQLKDGTYYSKTGILAPAGENTNVRALLESTAHNVLYMKEVAEVKEVTTPMGAKKKMAKEIDSKRVIYTRSKSSFFAGSYNRLEDEYEIENTEELDDLYAKRNNQTLIKFFEELYK
ncbi:MAG: AAA family ATPase [Patescibacteria group bacterium]